MASKKRKLRKTSRKQKILAKKISRKVSAKISPDAVLKISRIARLYLNENETKNFSKDLNDVLRAFKELDKAITKNVEPSFQPLLVKNIFREDVVEPSISNEEALRNTRHKEKKFFRGPRAV